MPRKLVYYVACSVDGYIARKGGSFDYFLFEGPHLPDLIKNYPETFPVHLREQMGITAGPRRFDTVLMGRHTYEVGVRLGITSPYEPLRQYVFSRSMTESPDPGVNLHRGDPLALAKELKTENGMDIWLCGGSKLAGVLFTEVDELILKINPVVVGEGLPLFAGAEGGRPLTLIEHKTYSNGFVLARYVCRQGATASHKNF